MVSKLVAIAYPLATFVVVTFGALAALAAWKLIKSNKLTSTLEYFLTARNSMGVFYIGWSFYASFMGSWVAFSAPAFVGGYAIPSGMLGNVANAFNGGFPIICVAALSLFIRTTYPRVLSFSDFLKARYGPYVTFYVVLVMLVQMGVLMLAEFIQIGMLFESVLGTVRWPIIMLIAIVTTGYTAFGGLHVSIITDQFQAIMSFVLLIVLCIYMGVTFDAPLPKMSDEIAGFTEVGKSAFGVYFFMNMTYNIYGEHIWQRCWASHDKKTVMLGALMGACIIFIVVFCFGLFGLLARWGGIATVDKNTPFADLTAGYDYAGSVILFTNFLNSDGTLKIWITVVVTLICVSLSSSAIDTLENALVTCFSGFFLTKVRLLWVRILVGFLTMVPLIISLSKPGIAVNDMYLLGTLIAINSVIPLLLGLIPGVWSGRLITPYVVLVTTCISFMSLLWYGWKYKLNDCYYYVDNCDTYRMALKDLFLKAYTYDAYVVSIIAGIIGTIFTVSSETAFRHLASKFTDKVARWNPVPPVCLGQHQVDKEATETHRDHLTGRKHGS